jgi:hypothetical protein
LKDGGDFASKLIVCHLGSPFRSQSGLQFRCHFTRRIISFSVFWVGENCCQLGSAFRRTGSFEAHFLKRRGKFVWSGSDVFRREIWGQKGRWMLRSGCSKCECLLEQSLELLQHLGCASSLANIASCAGTTGAFDGFVPFFSFWKMNARPHEVCQSPMRCFFILLRSDSQHQTLFGLLCLQSDSKRKRFAVENKHWQ